MCKERKSDMKVDFENQIGDVVGTINNEVFDIEAAGSKRLVPSFILAMADGTFKVASIAECRHDKVMEDLDEHKIELWPKAGENEWVTAYYMFQREVPGEISFERSDNSFDGGVKLPLGEYLHKMEVRKSSIICVWRSNGHRKGVSSTLRFETTKSTAADIAKGTSLSERGKAIFILPNERGEWMASFARGPRENDVKDVFVKSTYIDRAALTKIEVPQCGLVLMCSDGKE